MTKLLWALPPLLLFLAACGSGPPKCPTVLEPGEGFELAFEVEWAIDQRVKALLRDPGSYERDTTHGLSRLSTERADGSRYLNTLEVVFRARNAFGGMASGNALVVLDESAEEGCLVVHAELVN